MVWKTKKKNSASDTIRPAGRFKKTDIMVHYSANMVSMEHSSEEILYWYSRHKIYHKVLPIYAFSEGFKF